MEAVQRERKERFEPLMIRSLQYQIDVDEEGDEEVMGAKGSERH